MGNYRILGIVPLSAIRPGETEPVVMTDTERISAINACAGLKGKVLDLSNGMCDLEVDVVIWDQTITDAQYSEYNGQSFVSPDKMSLLVDKRFNYDFFMVATPLSQTTVSTFRGLAIGRGWWVKADDKDTPYIGAHELGHKLESNLRPDGYTNFPACAENSGAQSVHCNMTYGYQSSVDETYLRPWFTGTLPDGTGMNATAWAMDSGTDKGLYTPIPTPVRQSPTDPLYFRAG